MEITKAKGDWGESFTEFPAKPTRVLSDYEKVELDSKTPLKRETPSETEKEALRLQVQRRDLENLVKQVGISGKGTEK